MGWICRHGGQKIYKQNFSVETSMELFAGKTKVQMGL